MLRNLRVGFTIAPLLLGAGIFLTDSSSSWIAWPSNAVARLLIAVGLLLIVAWFVLRTSGVRGPTKTALGKPVPQAATAHDIAREHISTVSRYSEGTINLFAGLLTDLPHYLERINENIVLDPDAPRLRLTTDQVYELAHSHGSASSGDLASIQLPEIVLVPLVLPMRGTLLDQFDVTDADGNRLSTLSYNESRGLLAYTLSFLLDMAINEHYDSPEAYPEKLLYRRDLLAERLILTICAPGPWSKQSTSERDRRTAALSRIDVFPVSDKWRERIKDFCRQLMECYVIVAELPNPEGPRVRLVYSQTLPLETPTNYTFNQWRERFGLSPSVVDVVSNAFFLQVQAYHLEFTAPTDQYVFDHHLERIDSRELVEQEHFTSVDSSPYVRVYYEEGRPNAHLYIRPQRMSATVAPRELAQVKSVIEFREIPPGALGGATAVAFASAVIVSFFALTRLGLQGSHSSESTPVFPTDVPAFLLALPGFVTVLLGSWIELSRLRRASLTTYLALVGTLFISLTSALYYLYGSARPERGTFVLPTIDGYVRISTDVGWLILMIIALTHFLFLFRQVVSELKYYGNCVRRRTLRQTQGSMQ